MSIRLRLARIGPSCYSICRKTADGEGYAMNLDAKAHALEVEEAPSGVGLPRRRGCMPCSISSCRGVKSPRRGITSDTSPGIPTDRSTSASSTTARTKSPGADYPSALLRDPDRTSLLRISGLCSRPVQAGFFLFGYDY